MAAATGVAVALAGGAALGGVASAVQQREASKKAERRQRRANEAERARANVQRSLERRRAINRVRVAQAQNTAAGLASGVTGQSSALQGASGSLGSNLGASIAEANRTFGTNQFVTQERQAAQNILSSAAVNAGITSAVTQPLMSLAAPAAGQALFN